MLQITYFKIVIIIILSHTTYDVNNRFNLNKFNITRKYSLTVIKHNFLTAVNFVKSLKKIRIYGINFKNINKNTKHLLYQENYITTY